MNYKRDVSLDLVAIKQKTHSPHYTNTLCNFIKYLKYLISFFCRPLWTILNAKSYREAVLCLQGWWDVTMDEMRRFIACIIYMGIVQLPDIHRYWSTSTLYHGIWARYTPLLVYINALSWNMGEIFHD